MERFCLLKKILSDGEPTADPVGYKETIDMYQESDRSSYLKEQEELLYKITGEKHSEENAKEDPEKGVQENDRKSVRLQYLSISRKLVEVFDIIKNYPFEKSTEQNAENDEEKFRELLLKFFTLDHKYAFKTVLYSQECTLDFLNEMLLMRYLEKDDNVYFRNNGPTKDVTDSDNEAEEYKKAADYQKNLRRKMLEKPVKTVVPIAPSCSKNAKIPTFGCGYVRMWMYDKNFRNLYEPVIGKSTKYERDKIAKWLKEDLKKYIGLLPKI